MRQSNKRRPRNNFRVSIVALLFGLAILQGLVPIFWNHHPRERAASGFSRENKSSTPSYPSAILVPASLDHQNQASPNNPSASRPPPKPRPKVIPGKVQEATSANVTTNRVGIYNMPPTPSLRAKKPQKCRNIPRPIQHIRVSNHSATASPRILCFVMTQSGFHETKVRAIMSTWGKRCDKMIVASNATDDKYSAMAMQADSSYLGLWGKLNETMQYIWDNHRNDGFDWVFKADDDTYLIMENLKEYLMSPQVMTKHQRDEPLVFGRRYSSPRYRNLANRKVYFKNPVNEAFGERFYKKINKHKPVIYNYGGPGYAMNWPYMKKFVEAMKGPDTVYGTPPEDQAHGVVMAYHDVWPQNTRDELKRERFHPESPIFMWSMDEKFFNLWNDNHKATGGLSLGPDCCSVKSIAFHHISPETMQNFEDQFYYCRQMTWNRS